jgi:hypothetical protein
MSLCVKRANQTDDTATRGYQGQTKEEEEGRTSKAIDNDHQIYMPFFPYHQNLSS